MQGLPVLGLEWYQAAGSAIGIAVAITLVTKLLGLISKGTSAGFRAEVRSEIEVVLSSLDLATLTTVRQQVELAKQAVDARNEELVTTQRREFDRIWAAIDDLRRRRGP